MAARPGGAESATTVTLYTDATCTTAVAGSGTAATFAGSGLAVGVPANTTSTFHAPATDLAGNVSGCSTASLSYTADAIPPTLSFTGKPAALSHNASPSFAFTAEAGATVDCSLSTGVDAFAPCASSPAQ